MAKKAQATETSPKTTEAQPSTTEATEFSLASVEAKGTAKAVDVDLHDNPEYIGSIKPVDTGNERKSKFVDGKAVKYDSFGKKIG